MEQRVSTNPLKKEFRTYVNSRSRKPLKAIIERMSKAALHPVSFWDQMKFLYCAERKVEFEVRVEVRLRLQLYHQISDPPPGLHGDGTRNSLAVVESRREQNRNARRHSQDERSSITPSAPSKYSEKSDGQNHHTNKPHA